MRTFVKGASAIMLFLSLSFAHATAGSGKLSGFIVSDSHFGWLGKQQPSPAKQLELMRLITGRFPDLDVFIDTGDAHHDYALDDARGDWTDIVQGGCGKLPFYYIAGNHDNNNSLTVDDPAYDYDSEFRTNKLGSVECQPYYSFDIKGVHFVSLPQAMDQAYVTESSLAWLKLDLDIHKDKTTIILSHNALAGTASVPDDPGYRQVSNSKAVFDLLKKYPQVVAWMYGHNHTYEVVPLDGIVYVSNGRFGGFEPRNAKLGGIYFEITDNEVTVKCFSAEDNKFFDELPGMGAMSYTLRRPTSLDPAEAPAVCYGMGGSPHGQAIDAYRHHVGGSRTLYVTGAENPVINENSQLSVYTQRSAIDWQTKHLSGFSFEPNEENPVKNDPTWQWIDPGVRILKREDPRSTKGIFAPGATLGQRSYYRCSPGQRYKVTFVVNAGAGGQIAVPQYRMFEKHFVRVADGKGGMQKLPAGESQHSWEFEIPALDHVASIYSDPASDNDYMLTVGIVFSNVTSDIDILSMRLTLADAVDSDVTASAVISVDGQRFAVKGNLQAGQTRSFDIATSADSRTSYKFDLQGNKRVTWLEKVTSPRFQVRNATACYRDGKLVIGPLRNNFSTRQEVVIVPMTCKYELPYVHRIRHAKEVTITEATPDKRQITIDVGGLWIHTMGEVDIVCDRAPATVKGTTEYKYANGMLTVKVKRESTYHITWP